MIIIPSQFLKYIYAFLILVCNINDIITDNKRIFFITLKFLAVPISLLTCSKIKVI